MDGLRLFLGLPQDPLLESHLQKNTPQLQLYTSGGDYLYPLYYENQSYLGKYISVCAELDELESMERHLLSLLKKIAPTYPFEANSLYLIPVHDI